MCPGPGRCSPLPARLTFTGRIHNTCTQPHPVALPHGSVGFASDPRIPPGPSVTTRASHVKAPSHLHLTLLPQSTPVPPKMPLPWGQCLPGQGLLPEPILLRTEIPPSAAGQQDRVSPHLTCTSMAKLSLGFQVGQQVAFGLPCHVTLGAPHGGEVSGSHLPFQKRGYTGSGPQSDRCSHWGNLGALWVSSILKEAISQLFTSFSKPWVTHRPRGDKLPRPSCRCSTPLASHHLITEPLQAHTHTIWKACSKTLEVQS